MSSVYEILLSEMTLIFGKVSPLASGNGARFRSKKGVITVYCHDIHSGNRAEIAFNIDSFSKSSGKSEGEIKRLVAELTRLTGHGVKINPDWQWPRVGLSNADQVGKVVSFVKSRILNMPTMS